jgi:hypothetical protein
MTIIIEPPVTKAGAPFVTGATQKRSKISSLSGQITD